MHKEYTDHQPKGISQVHRALLARLHRNFKGTFTSREAADCLGLPAKKANRLFAHWASRGWLSRIRRGMYITVPLDAINPSEWRVDPWLIADALFAPCYIGGWSAAEYWGLTEQIFNDIVVFTSGGTRRRSHEVKGTRFIVISVPVKRITDFKTVWRDDLRVKVSSPARTVIDILDKPELGGGIRHAAQITVEFFQGEHSDHFSILSILESWKNKSVCKRLGFIIETFDLDAPAVLAYCCANVSSGYSRLDPSIGRKGTLLRKWMLEVNATLGTESLSE
ncbi:MAG: type IV toxin-antitoxin system AbiEi family antitoxin domain-containing protein [Candidatus Aegiribacteria sp.]|nr:type IV toxin-antitoxin system AbiEi family antitoxin domain-containing protein [Candidatus Aegiribacteria sp.]